MSESIPLLSLFTEIDLMSSEVFRDIDMFIEIRDPNDPSPLPKSYLLSLIQKELSTLGQQLSAINEKITKNHDILRHKQSQNEEMKNMINRYNESNEKSLIKAASCKCSSSCSLF